MNRVATYFETDQHHDDFQNDCKTDLVQTF